MFKSLCRFLAPSSVGLGSDRKKVRVLNAFTRSEAQRFLYHVILQRYDPPDLTPETERRLIALQSELHAKWKDDVVEKPLTQQEQQQLCSILCRYCLGQAFIDNSALAIIESACSEIGLPNVSEPRRMLQLLERVGYIRPNDNPHRLAHTNIELPAAVYGEVHKHVDPKCPFDPFRVDTPHNIYAIDSATTSEVDDAIGIHVDENGIEWITVYVSDATVHCPFGSELEALTGRALATTTYLPEGVWFMLPKEIVEAATLRSDRPCRTFQLRFRIDEATAEVHDFSVDVGWAQRLRRITYDEVQDIYDRGPNWTKPLPSTPSWATEDDVRVLQRIHHYARIRLNCRLKKPRGFQTSLPEPLIKVKDRRVVSLEDQILGTKDARIAVAELMIAANEVCARVAASIKQPIPFRGSRPFSTTNEAALEFVEPAGVALLPEVAEPAKEGVGKLSSGSAAAAFARVVFDDLAALRGVTRAIYHHEPLNHNGLLMDYYCHSTSPLRRFPDMLVHHQLKVFIGRRNGAHIDEFILETEMLELCAKASDLSNKNRVMQKRSVRYWVLRHIHERAAGKPMPIVCLVGKTRAVSSSLEHRRTVAWQFVSDVFLPEYQITHVVSHNHDNVQVGDTLRGVVVRVDPVLDLLDIAVVSVDRSQSESESVMEKTLLPFGDR